jgi:hypothetical protein
MWYYNGEPVEVIDPVYKAFVYCITNLITGRKYIGLKTTVTPKYKIVAGKRRKNGTKESDWRTYWSSSAELLKDVEELGQDKFRRDIMHLCKMKAHANYLEAREQMDQRVLENSESFYNGIINCRVSRSHLKNFVVESG